MILISKNFFFSHLKDQIVINKVSWKKLHSYVESSLKLLNIQLHFLRK